MRVTLVQIEHNDGYDKKTRTECVRKILSDILSDNEKNDTEKNNREKDNFEKTDLIMLPEMWGTGFFSFESYHNQSESLDGETVTMLSEIAAKRKCYLFTGTFTEKSGGKYYNTAALLDRKGNIASVYRKIHLFGDERNYVMRGNEISVAHTDIGIIGMSICYDLRFPELYRKMSESGAQIFIGASAWPLERKKHLEILNRARAVENQAFLFSCCMAGTNNGVKYSGSSMIVSPFGEIVYEAGEGQSVHTTEVDLTEAVEYRRSFPALGDRIL